MHDQTDEVAVRLAVAIKQLRARLRATAPERALSLPVSQLAILKRLRDDGPSTAATLAAAEHVSQQAIAQQVAALHEARLVQIRPDPGDARKRLVSMTRAGERLFESAASSRNAWLARAITTEIAPRERAALAKAVELLERLAATPADR